MKEEISILGCGWLGFPLAIDLLQEGTSIKGSTTSLDKIEKLNSIGIKPYLLSLENLGEKTHSFLSSEILIINTPHKNVSNFQKLISHIERSKIKKIVFVSSTSVYANSNNVATEKTIVKNSKLTKIETLFFTNSNFETTIVRFGGLFGYDRKPVNFISQTKVFDDPEGYINFIHRDDCIQIIKHLINKNIWGEIFNACSDSHPKRIDFYTNEYEKNGFAKPIFNLESPSKYKIVNSDKLKKVLNYTFKYNDLMDMNN